MKLQYWFDVRVSDLVCGFIKNDELFSTILIFRLFEKDNVKLWSTPELHCVDATGLFQKGEIFNISKETFYMLKKFVETR